MYIHIIHVFLAKCLTDISMTRCKELTTHYYPRRIVITVLSVFYWQKDDTHVIRMIWFPWLGRKPK